MNIQVTVSTVAIALATAAQLPQTVVLFNLGTVDVVVWGGDVTAAKGFTVPAGGSRTIKNCFVLWGITASGSANVNVVFVPPGVEILSTGGSGGGGGGTPISPGGVFTNVDANKACLAASNTGDLMTSTGITGTPVGPLMVYRDGQWQEVGYGTNALDLYFADPSAPTVPRAQGAIVPGDLPFLGARSLPVDTSSTLSIFYFTA